MAVAPGNARQGYLDAGRQPQSGFVANSHFPDVQPGGGEIADLMHGGMGFVQPGDKPVTGLDQKVERTAVEAARRKFSPEFMNRLDKVVVFRSLKREQLQEVLDIELGEVQQRVLDTAKGQFLFRVTDAG